MSEQEPDFISSLVGEFSHTPEEEGAVRLVHERERRVYWLQDPEHPERSAFVAPNPGAALQWIVRQTTQKKVIAFVRGKRSRTPDENGTRDENGTNPKRAKLSWTTTSRSRKHLKKTVDDAKVFYRSIWHNSQEATENAQQEDAFSRERAKWLQFAGRQPESKGAGAGVAEAIKRAVTVGSSEAVRDLQLTLRHWRACHGSPPSSSQALALPSEAGTRITSESLMALRDGPPRLRARYHYLRVERAEQLGAGLAIARRYHAARLREDYHQRIARELQPEREPPISRKRKAEIQAELYLDIRPNGTAVRGHPDFEAFQRTLKYGRRWLTLEAQFGAGIFALFPKTRVPSTYVERTLTDDLFAMWVRALHACSPLVVRMARAITPLVCLLVDDRAPPPQRSPLEREVEELADTECPTEELAELLEAGSEHARVQEIDAAPLEDEDEDEDEDGEGRARRRVSETPLFLTQAESDGVGSDGEERDRPGSEAAEGESGEDESGELSTVVGEMEEDVEDQDFERDSLSDGDLYSLGS